MRRLYIFLVCRLLGVLGGPITGDPAPGRSPGPPAGMAVVEEAHGGVVEDIPTLLLTKDPTEYADDEIVGSSKDNHIYDNRVHKSKLGDNHSITTTLDTLSASTVGGKNAKSVLSPCERASSYLRPTDTVTRIEFDPQNVQSPPLRFDVTHDVFDTSHGIVRGLIYTVTLECTSSVRDFFVESFIDGVAGGRFIDSPDLGKSSSGRHRWQQSPFGAMSVSSMSRERENVDDVEWMAAKSWHRHHHEDFRAIRNSNDAVICGPNTWSRTHVHGHETYSNGWSASGARDEPRQLSFRVSYRTDVSHGAVFEMEISMELLRDCKLFLRHLSGSYNSTSMPIQQSDCNVFFPSQLAEISMSGSATYSGLLVHLTRLNVPCTEGGFLKFNGHRQLCGKLEELPHNERSYYFVDHKNTSVHIAGHPFFTLEYKIVDYCYNVTLSQRNQTFFLQPTGSLECYFKIHLPYGYRISLMLTTNAHNVSESTRREFVDLNQTVKHGDACEADGGGLRVQIYDQVTDRRWIHCYSESSASRKITLISSDNSLVVAVRKFTNILKASAIGDASHLPSLQVEYSAQSIESIVSQCAFGWVASQQFCISAIEALPQSWLSSEAECVRRGGHLASIKSEQEQRIVDRLLINSPGYKDHMAYWIGASDKSFEGDFRWSDGLPFSYTNWFPGWPKFKEYNRQPNDDGLSSQDCVEMRRLFRLPPGNQPSQAPLTTSFMWNDRDCEAENYFICERPMMDEPVLDIQWRNDCNKTVQLTSEHSKINVWSPGFPHPYPDNVNCFTLITAPPTYRIIIDFEELVLEDEPQCSYDMLELSEPNIDQSSTSGDGALAFLHPLAASFAPVDDRFRANDATDKQVEEVELESDRVALMPRKLCGDWSSKLKLLRHVTKGSTLGLHFISDYSHHYSGYKAKVYMENAASECGDERQKPYNKSCYLFVSYPEVDWWTAQQVCRSIGAQLASVTTVDEQRFITSSIRNDMDYSPRGIYWLGGEVTKSGNLEWSDGTDLTFQDWLPGEVMFDPTLKEQQCVGLQWRMSPTPMLPSGLYWSAQRCSSLGGYVCKKTPNRSDGVRVRNHTVTGTEGRLTSPGYPNGYPPNTDYVVKIISPERTRIVVQFQRIDLEAQEKCLYDYVSVENGEMGDVDPGTNPIPMAMLTDVFNEWRQQRKRSVAAAEKSLKAHIQLLATTNRFITSRLMERRKRLAHEVGKGVDNFPSYSSYVRWCGSYESNMSRFDFISSTNQALVHFHSDYSISGVGFSATWTAIDITGCPEQTLTSKEGVFMSPNYPHFLLDQLDCAFVLQAPIGRKVWLEFTDFDIIDDASVIIDLGDGEFHPFTAANVLNDGVFLSAFEKLKVVLTTGTRPRGKGFRATYKTIAYPVTEERTLNLMNASSGILLHLNYPLPLPPDVDFMQHLVVALGEVITLELHGVAIGDGERCSKGTTLEIYDNYADNNGSVWVLCSTDSHHPSPTIYHQGYTPIFITSYLNTLHIRQRTRMGTESVPLNATVKIHPDANYKPKLASRETWVESCQPNPCQFGGKCVTNGDVKRCQCRGHYSGRFCGLTICDFDPCIFGQCELTVANFRCNCLPGYRGETCDQKQKPCADNPCQGRGDCFEKNGGFFCRCHAWWEGQRCERKMIHIPYKPLSERMLQEPFWLGLITVFVVLAIIGLVWCAKRHFPEKIEKLLAEEADRNRPSGSLHSHHTSLREQLQFTTSIPQTTITTPGVPRSIFGRLGIRKPSILSLSSPQPTTGGATARTFSLDDLLRPPPRRTPSPRKKRNNSTPTRKNAAEKKQILQQLISPAPAFPAEQRPKLSLGELIQLSDNHLKPTADSESDMKETTFSESLSASTSALRPMAMPDPKLEKKVTFARLLSKVSAEISSGSDMEVGALNATGLSLPVDIPLRASSVPPSPCINDVRSPHSTSSNQGSDSLSSSDLALADLGRSNRRMKSKVSSADSILAMFKNFASSNAAANLSPSCVISPSTTPTASSPQDDAPGDDDSSTSSMHTPVSFSSGAPDSPVFYRQSTIEVPVLDPLSAHKSVPSSNLLHPPSILLEIPSGGNGAINKCLSPIREMPTPMPSPALTPIMPRPQRTRSPSPHDDPLSNSFSDEESNKIDLLFQNLSQHVLVTLHPDNSRQTDSEVENFSLDTPTSEPASTLSRRSKFQMRVPAISISIDIDPPTPEEPKASPVRPRDLVIPTLTIETPSPTKTTPPVQLFPGSPPPQRASIGETSFLFPNKQQKRLLKQLEKPTSLDLPFTPPLITITSNLSEVESDMDNMSPAPGKTTTAHLCVPGSTGMCYLSPFTTVTKSDRTTSEGNLSSSGYSSMASPGPSRCNSNNPLCPSENEEPGTGSSGPGLSVPSVHGRRQGSLFKSCQSATTSGSATSGTREHHDRMRNRSDSETLSDEALLESNDEGIGTDHIDEKIDEGEIKSAKELELYLGKELIENGKSILEEPVAAMAQLQLPSIVIQSDNGEKTLSPVSSRSESPLSERMTGIGRFSPLFYGKKDQQLPFTDSDGLYDFPSSDGKGNSTVVSSHRKNTGKRRERKSSFRGHNQSPSKSSTHLELPNKEASQVAQHNPQSSKYHHALGTSRKSPKRRPLHRLPVASSSSSSESLLSPLEISPKIKITSSPTKTTCVTYSQATASQLDSGEEVEEILLTSITKIEDSPARAIPTKKIHRLRAIGNQIRFLRRLEQSIKRRDHHVSPTDSCNEDSNDNFDSARITSPLLSTSQSKARPQPFKMVRQKRLHLYENQKASIKDRHRVSPNNIVSD